MTEIIIELEGARNARDLGGIRAAGGCITKTGRLFRSGALDSITPADAEKLRSMGLARIVDLRTEIESERCPDIVPNGVTYNFCPVLTGALMGVTREKRTTEQYGQHLLDELNRGISPKVHMQEMYKKIISSPFAQAAYGKFLKLLCETRDGAVLWHCSMGKDRAGIGALVALLALGVSREDAGEDYLLSTKLLCSNNEERAGGKGGHRVQLGG